MRLCTQLLLQEVHRLCDEVLGDEEGWVLSEDEYVSQILGCVVALAELLSAVGVVFEERACRSGVLEVLGELLLHAKSLNLERPELKLPTDGLSSMIVALQPEDSWN